MDRWIDSRVCKIIYNNFFIIIIMMMTIHLKLIYKIYNVITINIYVYIYIYIYIYTLTGHFIRYILLVPDWTHFCLQNCLNSLWHRFNKVLETVLRDIGPYWHDNITQLLLICRLQMMRISRSTTSQRCSIGLRSGDCGGYLSKVNSLSCSKHQSEMIWALWHGALFCW